MMKHSENMKTCVILAGTEGFTMPAASLLSGRFTRTSTAVVHEYDRLRVRILTAVPYWKVLAVRVRVHTLGLHWLCWLHTDLHNTNNSNISPLSPVPCLLYGMYYDVRTRY